MLYERSLGRVRQHMVSLTPLGVVLSCCIYLQGNASCGGGYLPSVLGMCHGECLSLEL